MSDGLLVVGAGGTLGAALALAARARAWSVIGTRRSPDPASEPGTPILDLGADAGSWPIPDGLGAAVICGAITRLEACRQDPAGSRAVNVEGTWTLARRLAERGVFVVFPSTNLVLSGDQPVAPATAPRAPRTEYGRQKAEVEAALESLGDRAAVVRLTKVVHSGWPLVTGWLASLRESRSVAPFDDMTCAPVLLEDAVQGILELTRRRASGLWQFSGPEDISYADLARSVATVAGLETRWVAPVRGGSARGSEPVPRFTSLDASRAKTELGLEFPGLPRLTERLLAPGRAAV